MDDIKLALQEHPRTDPERGGAGDDWRWIIYREAA